MKTLKKLTNLFISLFMVFALTTTVFAGGDDTTETGTTDTGTTETVSNSLTINNTGNTAHTFELYQIFTGDYSNGTLSNIKWGKGVSSDGQSALGDASKKASTITDGTDFANEVKKYLTNATTSPSVAAGEPYKFDKLDAGYYLVKDVDNSQKDTAGAYTSYIVQVVGQVTHNTKLDVPTVVKKVQDTNDSTGKTTGWQDSADYDIGDDVPYQITGTMPENIADYETYKYVFTDTMSKGLTYTANNAKITIGGKDVTSSFKETVSQNTDDGSKTVTWTCNDLKGIEGVTLDEKTKVVVTYTAKLNEKAVIGSAGNPNTVNLTYSNNPNKGGEGDTGKTPDDKNIVFTYKVVVNKKDEKNEALPGAEFTLSKVNADKTSTIVKTFTLTGNKENDPTTFTATGLDDGTYVLKETKTPAGYNTIKDQYFTITAAHETTADEPKLTSLSGDKLNGSAQTTITFTTDMNAGSLTTNVENRKGSTLPSTGGIGTTIFYAAGCALVVLAGAMIAARKRA